MTTGWCKSDSGVRYCCPCYLFFLTNISWNYIVKYAVAGKDSVLEWKSQAGSIRIINYDLCLMATSEEDMNVIMEKVK